MKHALLMVGLLIAGSSWAMDTDDSGKDTSDSALNGEGSPNGAEKRKRSLVAQTAVKYNRKNSLGSSGTAGCLGGDNSNLGFQNPDNSQSSNESNSQ